MVGPTLTGKSSFLNQLIGSEIYKVGNTTNPTTKGVWGYIHYLNTKYESLPVLFLDCQGFDNIHSNPEADIKLLMLLIALDSHIFHISFGALDSGTVNRIASIKNRIYGLLKR